MFRRCFASSAARHSEPSVDHAAARLQLRADHDRYGANSAGAMVAEHGVAVTVLDTANAVIAGVLALASGQGLPERLHKDEVEFRRPKGRVEETESLLAAGIVGDNCRDCREVGGLDEVAFRCYE